ncbi:MAG: PilN domain-containing protein [Geobacteraceae bacterium]|nr:PilN domain-containing protein [Geobacteraceae bacterium]
MIKINLLPVRAAKRKESARQQALVLVGALVFVLLIALAAYSFLLIRINSTKDEISKAEQELSELKVKIGKIKELEKLKAEVTRKLDVLKQLRREKTGPVNRLLTVSQSVPDKLWLTSYAEGGSSVTVKGVAFTEELIADFMRSLEQSPDFKNVELIVSEQVLMSGMKLKKFELRFNLETSKG